MTSTCTGRFPNTIECRRCGPDSMRCRCSGPAATGYEHPRVTVAAAVASLEAALTELDGSPAAAHTRRQFHQLLLALERDGHVLLDPPTRTTLTAKGRILAMPRGRAPLLGRRGLEPVHQPPGRVR